MSRADDFLLTDEELRLRRRRRLHLSVALATLAAFLVGGYFAARPTLNAIKGWQARRHAQKAFAFIEQENWVEARTSAVAGYQLRPSEPEAIRAVARLLSRTRQSDALEFWKKLEAISPLSGGDLRDAAAIAMLAGDAARADAAIRQLTGTDATPADWLLAAQFALQQGRADTAVEALGKVFDSPAATERQQLQAALLQLSTAAATPANQDDAARVRGAWDRIEKLSEGRDAVAMEALAVLARQLVSRPAGEQGSITRTIEQVSGALQAHPLARAAQKLLAFDLLAHQDATQREALIARAVVQWKDAENIDLAVLAAWLNSKGEYQRQLNAIPLEKALQTRDLFLQHVDALGALDRWAEIKQLLEAERFPLDPVVQLMYLARCNAQLGEKAAAENNWRRAVEAARGDVSKLMTLANYAEKNGAVEIAAAAYETVAAGAPRVRAAQQARLRIAHGQRDAARIHAVLTDMLQLWPNDPAVQNDEAYMRLLLLPDAASAEEPASRAESLQKLEQLATGLVEREPRSLPHRTLLALARLRQDRPADALAVYSGINVPPSALTASALAVHAAVLAANGQAEDARKEASQIPAGSLLEEERALVAALL